MNVLDYIKNDGITFWHSKHGKRENFHNIDASYAIEFEGKEYDVCLQNGSNYIANDYSRPSNRLTLLLEFCDDFIGYIMEFFGACQGTILDYYKQVAYCEKDGINCELKSVLEDSRLTIDQAQELYNILLKSIVHFDSEVSRFIDYIEKNNDIEQLEKDRLEFDDFNDSRLYPVNIPDDILYGEYNGRV